MTQGDAERRDAPDERALPRPAARWQVNRVSGGACEDCATRISG